MIRNIGTKPGKEGRVLITDFVVAQLVDFFGCDFEASKSNAIFTTSPPLPFLSLTVLVPKQPHRITAQTTMDDGKAASQTTLCSRHS